MPPVASEFCSIPATTNPLGVKGGSEAGNIAAPPAIVNAIVDALSSLGVVDLPLPVRAEHIWRIMNETKAEVCKDRTTDRQADASTKASPPLVARRGVNRRSPKSPEMV
jgi:carbon-monoxide dehydrogenase large subunit